MWKEHQKEIITCLLSSIFVVIGLLAMVTIFEEENIHVAGSREMWIGFIGAVVGGIYTFMGVLITIFKQEEADIERKRLDNMPILGFEIVEFSPNEKNIGVLKYDFEWNELFAADTIFEDPWHDIPLSEMILRAIRVTVVNGKGAFDFTIEESWNNEKISTWSDSFNPRVRRLAEKDVYEFVFFCKPEIDEKEFFIIRFSYKDIFENEYYQDLPFIYTEEENQDGLRKQNIQIRDIKPPAFVEKDKKRKDKRKKQKDNSLEKAAEGYVDYAWVHFIKQKKSTPSQM